MSRRPQPKDLELAREVDRHADQLMWCLTEQYTADDDHVLRGGNELVSFYCRPTPEQAAELAKNLERVVGPIRRANALATLDRIDELSTQLRSLLASVS